MQFSDILVKNALFCDETEDYRTPAEPEAGRLCCHPLSDIGQ